MNTKQIIETVFSEFKPTFIVDEIYCEFYAYHIIDENNLQGVNLENINWVEIANIINKTK